MNTDSKEIQGSRFERVTFPIVVLILANLMSVYGVFFLGWTVYSVVLFFWFENIVIGILNILKMLFAEPTSILKWFSKFLLIPFFVVHYGIFTLIHGIIVVGIFGGHFADGGFDAIVMSAFYAVRDQGLFIPAIALFISHGFSFIWNYIYKGEYKAASLQMVMAGPYGRVIVLHATVILGGFLVMESKAPMVFMLMVVAIKIIMDVMAHIREHEKFKLNKPDAVKG
jgi:hypothetical protein